APLPTPAPRPAPRARARDFTVQGVDNLLVQLARCCQPLPGEPIAGYLTRGRGVTVHRADCAAFRRLVANQPQRSLPVEWGVDATAYEVDVEVMAVDRKWLLKEITNVIAQANVHVAGIRSDAGRSGARVRFRMRLRVSDYGQLSALLGKLAALPGVEQARRT
ncbi:ACT domain-containing protein, partial [Lysobacter zhanggongensis]